MSDTLKQKIATIAKDKAGSVLHASMGVSWAIFSVTTLVFILVVVALSFSTEKDDKVESKVKASKSKAERASHQETQVDLSDVLDTLKADKGHLEYMLAFTAAGVGIAWVLSLALALAVTLFRKEIKTVTPAASSVPNPPKTM